MPIGNYDPRVVANYIVKKAGRPVRQIALQKLLYFSHGLFLVRHKEPLVKGSFEAWHYGPVHPAIYQSFKKYGSNPISEFTQSKDLRTGEMKPLPELEDPEVMRVVDTVLHAFGDLTDGQLVDLSHAPAGPWDVIKQRAKNERMVGLRISNELIAQRFGKHKLSTCTLTSSGDVYDGKDAPIAYHGFG